MSNSPVLEGATFGRIRSNNSTAKDSKALREIEELAKTWTYEEFERRAAAGQSIIWGGSSWEAPLVRASGAIPLPFALLWAKDSRQAQEVAENHHQVPSEFCSMIKSMIGRLHLNKDSHIRRILYFGSTCEPISMVLEKSRAYNYDIHIIDSATAFQVEDRRDDLVRFLVKELEKVSLWLTGKPVDQDHLRAELRLKNQVNAKLRRILDLRLKNPFYFTAAPTRRFLAGANNYLGNPERYLAILDQAILELEEAAKTPDDRFYIPLILAGGDGGNGLVNAIEESRGAIVGFVVMSTSDFREDLPPLEALAHYLFDAQLKGELGEGAGASATLRYRRIEELIKHTGARGLVSSFVTACPYGSVVQQLERNHFRKRGFPTVSLEHTVHKEPPTEEQVMKVKTFIDMLS